MSLKIQTRRDSKSNWESSNPILSSGEFGYDTTSKKFKIGDGTTHWNDLGYSGGFEFIFIQPTPSSVWSIEHKGGCYPHVTVIDSANNQVEGSVVYDDLDNITVSFTAAFSGKAVLR